MNCAAAQRLRSVALYRGLAQKRHAGSLPTIARPSFWMKMVPKPLRRSPEGKAVGTAVKATTPWRSREWNPMTFYIGIFLCIGSMAIQMISLNKNFDAFMRQSEVKIGLLREVVERIQKGEDVDVERVLGTQDPAQEAEWDAVLKELERDDLPKRQQIKKAASKAVDGAASEAAAEIPAKPTAKVASITSFY